MSGGGRDPAELLLGDGVSGDDSSEDHQRAVDEITMDGSLQMQELDEDDNEALGATTDGWDDDGSLDSLTVLPSHQGVGGVGGSAGNSTSSMSFIPLPEDNEEEEDGVDEFGGAGSRGELTAQAEASTSSIASLLLSEQKLDEDEDAGLSSRSPSRDQRQLIDLPDDDNEQQAVEGNEDVFHQLMRSSSMKR